MLRVVIIGAGAAGMAAATHLVAGGLHTDQLTILEAQHRIGGRIHTVNHNGAALEMGANWVHGEEDNVVHRMASAAGELLTDQRSTQSSGLGDDIDFVLDGAAIDAEQRRQAMHLLERIVHRCESEPAGRQGSLGQFVTAQFTRALDDGALPAMERPVAAALLDWYHWLQNIIDGADDWSETCRSGHYRECAGDPLVTWRRGYSVLFDILTKDLPKEANGLHLPLADRIRLNRPAVRIDWAGADGVVVTCADGSTYAADHVLVTCSLGVLKANPQLFRPSLPERKRRAIEFLGFGTVDKLYLRFERPWWRADWGGVSLLVGADDAVHYADWSMRIQGFYTVRNQPDLLVAWLSGAAARRAETLTPAEVLAACWRRLRASVAGVVGVVVDGQVLAEPVELIRSTWFADEFTRGSYSYRSLQSNEQDVWAADLEQPVADRLFFAGEATHGHFYSTVHGAVESGWREADRILQLIQSRADTPRARL